MIIMRLFLIFLFLIPGLQAEENSEDKIKRQFQSELLDAEVPEKFISYFTEEAFLHREKHLANHLEEFRKASQDGEQSHYVQILLSMNKHLRDNQAVDFHWVETDLAWTRGWESGFNLRQEHNFMVNYEKGSRGLYNFKQAYSRYPFVLEFDSYLSQPQAQAQSDYFGDQSYARMEEIRFSGSITRRDSEGKKQSFENWSNGKLDGKLSRFYKNGKKFQEIEFRKGKPHGLFTFWEENGRKLIEVNYKNGLPYGKLTHWHLNGIPKATAYYQEGLPVGKSQMWDPSGKLLEAIQWENGRPWNATIYKSDGTPFKAIGLKRGNGVLPWQSFRIHRYNEFIPNWEQERVRWDKAFTESIMEICFLNGYRVKQGKEITWENNMRVTNLTSQSTNFIKGRNGKVDQVSNYTECKFVDGKAQGVEIKLENERIVQKSYYQKGVRHGLTTRWDYTPNGEKLILWKANFEWGILDGNCTWWSYRENKKGYSGQKFLQQIQDDEISIDKEGNRLYLKNDYIVRQATLKMGVLQGPFVQWEKENQISIEGNYKNNLKHGKWVRRDKQERIFSEIEWKKGRRWNAQVTKPNGQTCELTTLEDGNGSLCSYSTDGNLISFLSFSNGLPHGLWMKANGGNLLKGYISYIHFVDGKIEDLSLKFENQSNRVENYRNHSLDGLVYQLSREYKNSRAGKIFNFGFQHSEDKYLTLRESFSIHKEGLNLNASGQEQNTEKSSPPTIPDTPKDRNFSLFEPWLYRKISDMCFSSGPEFKDIEDSVTATSPDDINLSNSNPKHATTKIHSSDWSKSEDVKKLHIDEMVSILKQARIHLQLKNFEDAIELLTLNLDERTNSERDVHDIEILKQSFSEDLPLTFKPNHDHNNTAKLIQHLRPTPLMEKYLPTKVASIEEVIEDLDSLLDSIDSPVDENKSKKNFGSDNNNSFIFKEKGSPELGNLREPSRFLLPILFPSDLNLYSSKKKELKKIAPLGETKIILLLELGQIAKKMGELEDAELIFQEAYALSLYHAYLDNRFEVGFAHKDGFKISREEVEPDLVNFKFHQVGTSLQLDKHFISLFKNAGIKVNQIRVVPQKRNQEKVTLTFSSKESALAEKVLKQWFSKLKKDGIPVCGEFDCSSEKCTVYPFLRPNGVIGKENILFNNLVFSSIEYLEVLHLLGKSQKASELFYSSPNSTEIFFSVANRLWKLGQIETCKDFVLQFFNRDFLCLSEKETTNDPNAEEKLSSAMQPSEAFKNFVMNESMQDEFNYLANDPNEFIGFLYSMDENYSKSLEHVNISIDSRRKKFGQEWEYENAYTIVANWVMDKNKKQEFIITGRELKELSQIQDPFLTVWENCKNGELHFNNNDFQKAYLVYEESLKAAKTLVQKNLSESVELQMFIYCRLGDISYRMNESFQQRKKYYLGGLEVFKESNESVNLMNISFLVKLHYGLIGTYKDIGDDQATIDSIQKLLFIFSHLTLSAENHINLNDRLATILTYQTDDKAMYDKAVRNYKDNLNSLAILEKLEDIYTKKSWSDINFGDSVKHFESILEDKINDQTKDWVIGGSLVHFVRHGINKPLKFSRLDEVREILRGFTLLPKDNFKFTESIRFFYSRLLNLLNLTNLKHNLHADSSYLYLNLAECNLRLNRYDEAVRYYEDMISNVLEFKEINRNQLVPPQHAPSKINYLEMDSLELYQKLEESLALKDSISKSDPKVIKIKLPFELERPVRDCALLYALTGDMDKAIEYYLLSGLTKEDLYKKLSLFHIEKNNLNKAFEAWINLDNYIKKYGESSNNNPWVHGTRNSIGRKIIDEAIIKEDLSLAENIWYALGKPQGTSSQIGIIHFKKENYERAIEYFKVDLLGAENWKFRIFDNYRNLAISYLRLKKYKKAIEYYDLAWKASWLHLHWFPFEKMLWDLKEEKTPSKLNEIDEIVLKYYRQKLNSKSTKVSEKINNLFNRKDPWVEYGITSEYELLSIAYKGLGPQFSPRIIRYQKKSDNIKPGSIRQSYDQWTKYLLEDGRGEQAWRVFKEGADIFSSSVKLQDDFGFYYTPLKISEWAKIAINNEQYEYAIIALESAVDSLGEIPEDNPLESIRLLVDLSSAYFSSGKQSRGMEMLKQALKIFDSLSEVPEDNPLESIQLLVDLSSVCFSAREKIRGVNIFNQAMKIFESFSSSEIKKDSSEYDSINLIIIKYLMKMEDYKKAEEISQEYLLWLIQTQPDSWDKVMDKKIVNYIIENFPQLLALFENYGPKLSNYEHGCILYAIGMLSRDQSFLKKAFRSFENAIRNFSLAETKGSNAERNNARRMKANGFQQLGLLSSDRNQSEKFLMKALSLYDNLDEFDSKKDIANCYLHLGKYGKAEEIFGQIFGPNNIYEARIYKNKANDEISKGNFYKAIEYAEKSIQIHSDYPAQEPIELAEIYETIGYLHAESGDFTKSLGFLEQSSKIIQSLEKSSVNFSQNQLRSIKASINPTRFCSSVILRDWEMASQLADNFVEDNLQNLKKQFSHYGRKEKLDVTSNKRIRSYFPYATPTKMAQYILRTKGIVLDSIIEDEDFYKASQNSRIRDLIKKRDSLERALHIVQSDPKLLATKEKGIRSELGLVSERLAEENYNKQYKALTITLSQIQRKLPANSVLVEFIEYPTFNADDGFSWDEEKYGAVILFPNTKSDSNDSNIQPVRIFFENEKDIKKHLNELLTWSGDSDKTFPKHALPELYRLVAKPIIDQLPENIDSLILSPDGILNFLPFSALHENPGSPFLAEQFNLFQVSSGRDLLDEFETFHSKTITLFGNPEYKKALPSPQREQNLLAMQMEDNEHFRNLSLAPLPGTAEEVAMLLNLVDGSYQTTAHLGPEATEENLRQVQNPGILHLATHGFFIESPDKIKSNSGQSRFFGLSSSQESELSNPMRRAGLALAGAQNTFDAWAENKSTISENDGIFTGEEAAVLSLKNTWLTTLSACETGKGSTMPGEGVFGLRRAFYQAGTQNLLLTLWPVNDYRTVDFMKSFYEAALKDGDAAKALVKVQRELLVQYREQFSLSQAVRYIAPFVLTFRGPCPEMEAPPISASMASIKLSNELKEDFLSKYAMLIGLAVALSLITMGFFFYSRRSKG